jgi:hypothetical protein
MLNCGQWQGHIINYEIKSIWMRILQFKELWKLTQNAFKILYSQKIDFNNLHFALEIFFGRKVSFEFTQDFLTPWLVPSTI